MSTFSRPLPNLPNELICQILDSIGYKADLIAVSLLSRSWLNCSRERLFKDVAFKNLKSLVQFAKLFHSPYRTIPDTFQHIYLNPCHWDPSTSQDRLIVIVTLALITAHKFTIRTSGKAVIPSWPLTATKGQWESIRHLVLIGGIYSAPKFFEYIGSFPKLELLDLYAASFYDGWEDDTVHYSFPPTVKTLILTTNRKTARFIYGRTLEGGGFSAITHLDVWTFVEFFPAGSADDPSVNDQLSSMFAKGYLSHLERIYIRQRSPVYCVLPGDRHRFEGPFNMLSTVLSNVNKLTHFALDYRQTGFEGFYYSFKGHVAAITSANSLETLEIYPPSYVLCSRPLNEIDVELDKVYRGRADIRNRWAKFNIIIHGIHRTDGTSQDLMPQAVERGHRISLKEE